MKLTMLSVVVIAMIALGLKFTESGTASAGEVSERALFTARRAALGITVTENGYLTAKNSVRLKPKFRREGTITWLIDEGEEVKEGDILIEFDRTELDNQIAELETSLIQFEIQLEAATAELGIQGRDNEAAIEKSGLALEIAKLELDRYEKGEAPNDLRKMKLAARKAESEFLRAQERFEQVPELESQGFLTKIQVEEERIRLDEAQTNKENAAKDLELHVNYTERIEITTRQSKVTDATRELKNARIKADINLKAKQAQVKQQERQVSTTKSRLEQLGEEVENMTLKATQNGVVHYGDPNRRWMREYVKVGNTLHQGNTAITLPDLTVMQVLIEVHEADIDQVELDMNVLVTIETHKGMSFPGKVTDIATVANSQSWDDETNKTFRVEITMEPVEISLRAGVTARAEVQIEEIPGVLQVPIHAVFPDKGKHHCFVYTGGEIERREVSIGKSNAHHVVIESGIVEGDRVLLYGPEDLDLGDEGEPVEDAEEASEDSDETSCLTGTGERRVS